MAQRNVDLTSQEWRDLIFEGKNKEFGAYDMRKRSAKRHNLAALFTLIGLVIIALLVWGLSAYNAYQKQLAEEQLKAQQEAMARAEAAQEEEVPEEEEEEVIEKMEEPEVQEIDEQVLETVKDSQTLIADDVKTEMRDELEKRDDDRAVGAVTQAGSDDVDRVKEVKEIVQVKEEPKPVEVKKEEPAKIFTAVEQPASFPGGQAALTKWLNSNLKYPERAAQNDIQGRVIVQFVVNADGSIEQVRVAKGVDKDLDAEAMRVVKKMPKWQPGKNNGHAVRSLFTLPVQFKLAQ